MKLNEKLKIADKYEDTRPKPTTTTLVEFEKWQRKTWWNGKVFAFLLFQSRCELWERDIIYLHSMSFTSMTFRLVFVLFFCHSKTLAYLWENEKSLNFFWGFVSGLRRVVSCDFGRVHQKVESEAVQDNEWMWKSEENPQPTRDMWVCESWEMSPQGISLENSIHFLHT